MEKQVNEHLLPSLDQCGDPLWVGVNGEKSQEHGIKPEFKSAEECKSIREEELKKLLKK